ncbi:MAG: phosphoribosylformylglycinamidine synthase I [candidate division Zixibacteria bacterium CG_4_9_14_3_um_filter_46_8]|nr:MAG: phosphoribosylformylglycinamidine synthase I [candidate division Zixibacteria bacterium CG_4_9_14_3_um_filter_46_8]
MTFGIVVFPGSNCDYDGYRAIKDILGQPAKFIWHKDTNLKGMDVMIVPGGFSYGDYLRAGAIASFSPVIGAVKEFAQDGGLVMGICNGFQILTECGLLPGALRRNRDLRFLCRDVNLRTENGKTIFTRGLEESQVIRLPIAHNEGNYYCSDEEYQHILGYDGILFRYCDIDGKVGDRHNPNGSRESIAGIINEKGNVMGMMPHPERYVEDLLGGRDGALIFKSILNGN